MKKQLNTAIAALFLTTASMTAMAVEESSKGYFGISYGNASTDTGITGLTGTASLDEDNKGAKLFAGFNVDDNFAIEGHYSDFGEASLSGNNGDQFVDEGVTYQFLTTATVKIKAKSYGLAGVYKLNKINEITPFVKLGWYKWDAEATVNAGTVSGSASTDGTDKFYGLGFSYPLSDTVNIRTEFERYEVNSYDSDYVSVGISQNF